MGGLVVKQMLFQAKLNNNNEFLHNTAGIVSIQSHHVQYIFYTSCFSHEKYQLLFDVGIL
jgi:hypothetical protein